MTRQNIQTGDAVTLARTGTDGRTHTWAGIYRPAPGLDGFYIGNQLFTSTNTVNRLYGHLGCSQMLTLAGRTP
jgi:hypothetical protein